MCVLITDEMVRIPLGIVTLDALIIDVSGRVGSVMLSLYKTLPYLCFTVQDTAKMIEIGHQVQDTSLLSVLALTNQGRSGVSNSQMQSHQAESRSKIGFCPTLMQAPWLRMFLVPYQ